MRTLTPLQLLLLEEAYVTGIKLATPDQWDRYQADKVAGRVVTADEHRQMDAMCAAAES
jgi:hypothetical protein